VFLNEVVMASIHDLVKTSKLDQSSNFSSKRQSMTIHFVQCWYQV